MIKSKKFKKVVPVLLAGLMVIGGASAWLSMQNSAVETNKIQPGTVAIVFENEANAVNLTDSYPMTAAYAKENTTPYTFDVANDGTIDLTYSLTAVDYAGDIDANLVNVSLEYEGPEKLLLVDVYDSASDSTLQGYLDENTYNKYVAGELTYGGRCLENSTGTACDQGVFGWATSTITPVEGSEVEIERLQIETKTLEALLNGEVFAADRKLAVDESNSYTLYSWIDEAAVNDEVVNKSVSFKLVANAVQVIPTAE